MTQRLFALLLVAVQLMSVQPAAAGLAEFFHACEAPARLMQRVELIFGLSVKGGGRVSARDFRRFMAAEITPRFPDGLTVLNATGQWRAGRGSILREGARLVLIYVPQEDTLRQRLDDIVAAYRQRFRQDSVLVAQSAACVAF